MCQRPHSAPVRSVSHEKKPQTTRESLRCYWHGMTRRSIGRLPVHDILDSLGRVKHIPIVPTKSYFVYFSILLCPTHIILMWMLGDLMSIAEERETRRPRNCAKAIWHCSRFEQPIEKDNDCREERSLE